ncbi:conidial pigment biosynthesis oxidase Arb2, putative, partial [Rhizoctonia solani AG-3 Rhs1AP]
MQLRRIPLLVGALLPAVQAALRQHTLTVTNGTNNADGVTRSSWLLNGQTPGPHFVWDEGDDVSVTVINNGPEPITIHWHGIEQYGTPWSDGVPGLAQYPIGPGQNFVYNFTLYQYGFYWYHSHYKMQLDDGLKGTLYIRPSSSRANPFNQISNDTTVLNQLKAAEINPLMLNVYDYKHYTSEYWMSEWERTDVEQLCIDNILVNGKGQVKCPDMTEINGLAASYQKPLTNKGCMYPNNTLMFPYADSKPSIVDPKMWYDCSNTATPFEVFTAKESDGWVSFILLNSGALWDLRVSIDSHKLYFFAADGHYTQVQVATSVLIPIGERYQFFVKLDQTPGDYLIRTAAVVMPQMMTGYAILSYTSTGTTGAGLVSTTTLPAAKTPYIDYAGGITNGGVDLITANMAPYPANPPPQGKADLTLALNVTRTGEFGWPSEIASLDPKVYFSYTNGTLVDLIFTVTAGNPAAHPPHPMHKHGVKAWLLGSGTGAFPGINIKNPPLRDDFPTPGDITGKAWMAVRYRAVDPGPVILHCHIDPHLATGMVIVLLEGAEKMSTSSIPSYYLSKNKP